MSTTANDKDRTREKITTTVVIEGSLTAVLDDDSSDDDDNSDDDLNNIDDQRKSSAHDCKVGSNTHLESDDDEELEVFTENGDDVIKSNSANKIDKKHESLLVSAMMASVIQVESVETFGTPTSDKKTIVSQSNSAEIKTQPITEDESSSNLNAPYSTSVWPNKSDDIFGIAYKPLLKKKDDYITPKGAAFEDEAEFEKELIVQRPLRKKEEDDEFDFDDIPKNREVGISDDVAPAQKTIDKVSKLRSSAEEEKIFMETLREENKLLSKQESPKTKEAPEDTENDTVKLTTKSAAKQSLDEIVGIYSSGLGDQDVRLLDIDISKEKVAELKYSRARTKAVGTIDEGDEDEAEREEEEEELREGAAIADEITLRSQLESEWDNVDANNNSSSDAHIETHDVEFCAYSYDDALSFLSGLDFTAYESSICVKEAQTSSWALLNRPTQLKFENCEEKLKFPFLLANINFEPSTPELLNILRTIFSSLVAMDGSNEVDSSQVSVVCPIVGPHWERIGFQGLDPRTDINRSMKMLAILQTLHMVEKATSLTSAAYGVSILKISDLTGGHDLSWPFMCVSIMFTKEAILAMRSGQLNKDCNKQMDVLTIMNEFHQGCFFEFLRRIVDDPTLHHAVHLAKVRELCGKSPADIVKSYKKSTVEGYSAFSLETLYANVKKSKLKSSGHPAGVGRVLRQGDRSNGRGVLAVQAPVPPQSEVKEEAGDLQFDDLEAIEKALEAKTLKEKLEGAENEKMGVTRSIWSTLTGGGKASKFKA